MRDTHVLSYIVAAARMRAGATTRGNMSDTVRCPDCGTSNPASAAACEQCNFPLGGPAPAVDAPSESAPAVAAPTEPAPTEPAPTVAAPAESAPAEPTMPAAAQAHAGESRFDPGPRPMRRGPARPDALQPVQMQLWLFVGAAVVLGILYIAAQGFWKSNAVPVTGARPEQQQRADLARRTLEQDSLNVAARIELANVLYDTGNWSEAIIHYRSAERLEPRRATTVVDLGVCYYNLSQFAAAESLFQHALSLDRQQVFALFNLGIVAEAQGRWDAAMDFYHRAMQSNPPEGMKAPLQEHLQAVMAKAGKTAPPLGPK